MKKGIVGLLWSVVISSAVMAQAHIQVKVNTSAHEFSIPGDFAGLGFETRSVAANTYGVKGNFFSPENTELITLIRNAGVKIIRVGGGTVDGSGGGEHCAMPAPTYHDIDQLFEFARAAGVKVIYSVRLLNIQSCADGHLAEEDARIVSYIWNTYRASVASFSIGNEPDWRSYHSKFGHVVDAAIFETATGVPGTAYPSYLADWLRFAEVIRKAAPGATFSGPDTGAYEPSTFTPDASTGVSWTQKFGEDLKDSGMLAEALQHHYVWGTPRNTPAQEAIDNMLSSAWDDGTEIGSQPAFNGGKTPFYPYPFVYQRLLAPLVKQGIAYRMTEANDCLHGVPGASDGFAAALWALDYMHWWAAHRMAGVNFHNNPWLPTDTIVPGRIPCAASGCQDYRATAKALGMRAFALGSHGFVEPTTIANPSQINLTAYAVGTDKVQYVTIINRTHASTHDVAEARVEIVAPGFEGAFVDAMELTDGQPGNAELMTGTLGGSAITAHADWDGKWTPLGQMKAGEVTITVRSTTAQVVRIRASQGVTQ